MRIAILLGTRPEIIKLSVLISLLETKFNYYYYIIHSNQHYSEELDAVFFSELNINKPKYNLGVGSKPQGEQTGLMIVEIEKILRNDPVDYLLIHGDTNTTLAGAIAGSKLNLKVAHVEAGLRSYDKKMPEEINRIVSDHVSDILFAPTMKQREILISEGIKAENIFVIGNTIVDAVYRNSGLSINSLHLKLGLETKKYFVLTLHRPENVDNKDRLKKLILNLKELTSIHPYQIVFPVHPRTQKRLDQFEYKLPPNIIKIKPIGYTEMLDLIKNSLLILTDSGGIQEEATVLNIPCVTLRESTERPESIEVGGNILVGSDLEKLIKGIDEFVNNKISWQNPFGDGKSSLRVIEILRNMEHK